MYFYTRMIDVETRAKLSETWYELINDDSSKVLKMQVLLTPEEDSNDQKSSKSPGKLPYVAHRMPLIRLILTQLDRLDSPDLQMSE